MRSTGSIKLYNSIGRSFPLYSPRWFIREIIKDTRNTLDATQPTHQLINFIPIHMIKIFSHRLGTFHRTQYNRFCPGHPDSHRHQHCRKLPNLTIESSLVNLVHDYFIRLLSNQNTIKIYATFLTTQITNFARQ